MGQFLKGNQPGLKLKLKTFVLTQAMSLVLDLEGLAKLLHLSLSVSGLIFC